MRQSVIAAELSIPLPGSFSATLLLQSLAEMPREPDSGSPHVPEQRPLLPAGIEASELGRLLRQARLDQGLSLRQAAEAAGVSFSTLSRVEAGAHPDLTSFLKLTAWLGVSPELFLRPTATKQEVGSLEVVAHHLMTDPGLSPEAAQQIVTVVREMYRALAANRQQALAPPLTLHLRAASIMRPGVPERLASILKQMDAALRRRSRRAGGTGRRPVRQ